MSSTYPFLSSSILLFGISFLLTHVDSEIRECSISTPESITATITEDPLLFFKALLLLCLHSFQECYLYLNLKKPIFFTSSIFSFPLF